MMLNLFWFFLVCALITVSLKVWRSKNSLAFRGGKMFAGMAGILLSLGILVKILGGLAGTIVFLAFLSAIGFLYGMSDAKRNTGRTDIS